MHSDSQVCTGQVRWIGHGQLEMDYFNADDSELVLKAGGALPPVDAAKVWQEAPPVAGQDLLDRAEAE